eukprot:gene5904-6834_t
MTLMVSAFIVTWWFSPELQRWSEAPKLTMLERERLLSTSPAEYGDGAPRYSRLKQYGLELVVWQGFLSFYVLKRFALIAQRYGVNEFERRGSDNYDA